MTLYDSDGHLTDEGRTYLRSPIQIVHYGGTGWAGIERVQKGSIPARIKEIWVEGRPYQVGRNQLRHGQGDR